MTEPTDYAAQAHDLLADAGASVEALVGIGYALLAIHESFTAPPPDDATDELSQRESPKHARAGMGGQPMNRAAIAVLAAGALVTAAATYQLKQLNRDIRQARLLYGQMEEDHSLLVKLLIKTRDQLRTTTPRGNITPEAVEKLAEQITPEELDDDPEGDE